MARFFAIAAITLFLMLFRHIEILNFTADSRRFRIRNLYQGTIVYHFPFCKSSVPGTRRTAFSSGIPDTVPAESGCASLTILISNTY